MSALRLHARRGQALVLFALTMILVVLMACMTVSIAVRARERLEQQTLADTIAYSNAVASARAYNTLSLINRTALAHWVSLMAVQANVAWSTLHHAWFESLADGVESFGPGGCAQRQQQLRAAQHSLVHAGLSSYNRQGAFASDDVDMGRDHPGPLCGAVNERSVNPTVRNFGEEDLEVANQSRVIYDAILDLTDIQQDIWGELDSRVRGQEIATSLVKLSTGGSMGPYRMLDGDPAGDGPAWDAVSHAVGRGPTDDDTVRANSLVSLAHAAMGSRPSGFLAGGTDETPNGVPTYRTANRALPPWTVSVMDDIEADLNNHFGPDRFRFKVAHFAVRSYLNRSSGVLMGLHRVSSVKALGFGAVGGNAWARLKIEYRDPCDGGRVRERWIWAVADMLLDRAGTSVHQWGYGTSSSDTILPTRWDRGHASVGEGLTGGHNAKYGDDSHPGHRHWRENQERDHDLQGPRNESMWPRGFGFVFPRSHGQERNFPLFGQPRMPVLLARSYRPGDVLPDPWNLTVGMRFDGAGPGASFDMTAGRVAPDQTALATAILYYHRRRPPRAGTRDLDQAGTNGWAESPNLLNPYWHATLVRSDLGDRDTPTAPRVLPVNQRDEYNMLRDEGFTSAAEAYRQLERAGFRSWQ